MNTRFRYRIEELRMGVGFVVVKEHTRGEQNEFILCESGRFPLRGFMERDKRRAFSTIAEAEFVIAGFEQ